MSLKAIGAGFGRTGTESLKRGLEILGLGPTHHMYEVMDSEVQRERWSAFANGAEPDWPKLFEGFNSAVDWPSAAFWRETMEFYPNAKVILSYRPEEDWWDSFSKTIQQALVSGKDVGGLGTKVITERVFGGQIDDKDHVLSVYRETIDNVRNTVPRSRLIELPLGSGWAPLCDGLGLETPDLPYPSGNTQDEFRSVA
ncbi:MAG: sulfotransferase family protein [Paracoccaceae bacterium]